MDGGKIVEFDTPKELLKNQNGYLYSMVKSSHAHDMQRQENDMYNINFHYIILITLYATTIYTSN